MEVSEAFQLIERAIDSGRPAHGYLIVGEVRGNCSELVSLVLGKLFPAEAEKAQNFSHPDVALLESEGAARVIKVESMREKLVNPMAVTAFSGGWKVGVIIGADRMNAESANAFLKSLEEPTPKTMYLLLTDQPDAILPTIISRSQRIDLKLPSGELEGDDYETVASQFAERDAVGLAETLKGLEEAAGEDAALARKAFYHTLISFARKMMIDGKLPRYQAFRNIEAIEEAYRRTEKSLPDQSILAYMFDRIVFPTA